MAAFLRIYAATGRVDLAAKAAGVSRMLHYRRLKNDSVYKRRFEVAQEAAVQLVEDEAIERAMGVLRPVLYKGRPVKIGNSRKILYVKQASDQLWVFLLKRFRPQIYRENVTTEHTGSGSIELVERMQAARKRLFEKRAAAN
jgi:hypothetical protein